MVYHVGRPAMFDGNMFLPRHGDAHLEDRPQQDEIGGLAAGSVDGGDLDGEIVDDAFGALGVGRLLGRRRRSLTLFPLVFSFVPIGSGVRSRLNPSKVQSGLL